MVQQTQKELGSINGCFNNAGYQGAFEPVDQYPLSDFEKVYQINVFGVFSVLKYTSQAMIQAGVAGSIVNTASCAGLGCPTLMCAYGSSKAAVSPAFIGPED